MPMRSWRHSCAMSRAVDSREVRDPSSPEQIRNVVLVGPGVQEAALFDRLVAACVPGRRPRESHEASLGLAAAALAHNGSTINLLDTPGHDFVGEVQAGLRRRGPAVFVVSAVDGLDEATRLLWRECEVLGMPRAVAVTRLEQSRGTSTRPSRCASALRRRPAPRSRSCRAGRSRGRQPVAPCRLGPHRPGARAARALGGRGRAHRGAAGALIESVIEESEDESLLERYLGGEDIDLEAVAGTCGPRSRPHASSHPADPRTHGCGRRVAARPHREGLHLPRSSRGSPRSTRPSARTSAVACGRTVRSLPRWSARRPIPTSAGSPW